MNQNSINPTVPVDESAMLRAKYQTRLSNARFNIIAIVALTVLNIVMSVTGGGTYFLFSASVPYYLTSYMAALTGHLPEEIYADPANGWEGFEFLPDELFVFAIVVSVIILLLYVLCFFFAKKHYGWLIVTALMFSIDTLGLFGAFYLFGFDISDILDVAIHIWALASFILAAISGAKLKRLPPETFDVSQTAEHVPAAEGAPETPTAPETVSASTSDAALADETDAPAVPSGDAEEKPADGEKNGQE